MPKFNKKNLIHIVWPPPPTGLIHFFEVNNIHIKEFLFIRMRGLPPHCFVVNFCGTLPLGGIWLGLTPYRLPIDTHSEYPEPWLQQTRGILSLSSPNISVLKKHSPRHGGKCCEQKQSPHIFSAFPPMSWTLFFPKPKCSDYSRTHFLFFAGARFLDTH